MLMIDISYILPIARNGDILVKHVAIKFIYVCKRVAYYEITQALDTKYL